MPARPPKPPKALQLAVTYEQKVEVHCLRQARAEVESWFKGPPHRFVPFDESMTNQRIPGIYTGMAPLQLARKR